MPATENATAVQPVRPQPAVIKTFHLRILSADGCWIGGRSSDIGPAQGSITRIASSTIAGALAALWPRVTGESAGRFYEGGFAATTSLFPMRGERLWPSPGGRGGAWVAARSIWNWARKGWPAEYLEGETADHENSPREGWIGLAADLPDRLEKIEQVLHVLAEEGLGARRSQGYGQIEIVKELTWPPQGWAAGAGESWTSGEIGATSDFRRLLLLSQVHITPGDLAGGWREEGAAAAAIAPRRHDRRAVAGVHVYSEGSVVTVPPPSSGTWPNSGVVLVGDNPELAPAVAGHGPIRFFGRGIGMILPPAGGP
ncbi:MAG TPA: hypothetical protein VL860_11260 [Planctomycetota bacterium]|nr:hypothetical protein [Planctomycetota bacterium]